MEFKKFEDIENYAKKYKDNKIVKDVFLTDGENCELKFCQISTIKEGGLIMELETRFQENLPSPSYKTLQFSRTIRETLPDGCSKEDLLKAAQKQQGVVEALVKADIARHSGTQPQG